MRFWSWLHPQYCRVTPTLTKPGAINYGSAGVGSSNHIVGEMLKTAAGIDMSHIPFQGGEQSAK